MSSELKKLADSQRELLLAEAIGWLHDYRKCSEEQLAVQAANKPANAGGVPRNQLASRFPAIGTTTLSLSSAAPETLNTLLNDWEGKSDNASVSFLLQFLSRSHNTAHFDKQDPHGGKQNIPGVQISSAFGFEQDVPNGLTTQLWTSLPWATLMAYAVSDRANLLKSVRALFAQVGADTQRPINEVDLWGWGMLVGGLYKAALAGVVLGKTPNAHDLRWRFLSVRVDGLNYILDVVRIPDLLARRKLLTRGLNEVRRLLEETYPLGTEVYRDENGSIFVIPDMFDPAVPNSENVLAFKDENSNTLHQLISEAFGRATLKKNSSLKLGKDVTPTIELATQAWWGQDPDRKLKLAAGQPLSNELPQIGDITSKAVISPPEAETVKAYWKNHVADICTVCGIRPQGPDKKKSIPRKVCDTCEQRRTDRSMKWAKTSPHKTIWLDEVADINGRAALIVGEFDLAGWLDGTLIDSLVLIPPMAGATSVTKTSSFSRLRRVWETTRNFWKKTKAETAQLLSDDRRRLLLYLDQTPDLGEFHVYELALSGTTLSVVWYPHQPDGSGGYLISADNLGYVARQLGAESDLATNPAAAAIWLEDYVNSQFVSGSQQPVLRNSDAPQTERNQNPLAGMRIVNTAYQESVYSTGLPLLIEPRIFMTLVPADKSLAVVQAIKTKYEREFGKVRNRLPLHLGVTYFQRRTPLISVLDAGQRMLSYRTPDSHERWGVSDIKEGNLPTEQQPLADGTNQFDVTISVELTQKDYAFTWYVPKKMGDGHTTDLWYPYVFLETDGDPSKLNGRCVIPGQRPVGQGKSTACWLIHAANLQAGDQVYFAPSTFDFEFLDSAAQRFEISYKDGKRRGRERQARPYYLEEVEDFQKIWERLENGLATSQIKTLGELIETKRREWFDNQEQESNKVFEQYVKDAINNAAWKKDKRPKGDDFDYLVQAALRGQLADVIELLTQILKKKSKVD